MSKFLIGLIKFYRKCISPLKLPCCRFTPTCSQYAIEAITIHGAFKGTMLAIWRVLRCNPFCKGGFDPVPENKKTELKITDKDGV
ncbi:MAG: membrane protein insertion efficiency factor YidD [Clostridia bacterium]|nr:membrane protein insertion efficiency factor YidD [Clostridia bacterium]